MNAALRIIVSLSVFIGCNLLGHSASDQEHFNDGWKAYERLHVCVCNRSHTGGGTGGSSGEISEVGQFSGSPLIGSGGGSQGHVVEGAEGELGAPAIVIDGSQLKIEKLSIEQQVEILNEALEIKKAQRAFELKLQSLEQKENLLNTLLLEQASPPGEQ